MSETTLTTITPVRVFTGQRGCPQGTVLPSFSQLHFRLQSFLLKVLKYMNNRVSLSMKEVDQATGEDLNPREPSPDPDEIMAAERETARNPDRPAPKIGSAFDGATSGRYAICFLIQCRTTILLASRILLLLAIDPLVQVGIGPGPVIGPANFHFIGPGPVSRCTDNFGPGALTTSILLPSYSDETVSVPSSANVCRHRSAGS